MSSEKPRENSTRANLMRLLRLYMKSKIGLIGAIVIIFFILLAVLAPVIATNPPVTGFDVGAPFAVPTWATIFPQYSNTSVTYYPIPATPFVSATDLSPWQADHFPGSNFTLGISPLNPGNLHTKDSGSLEVNATVQTNMTLASSTEPNPQLPYGQVVYEMSAPFKFDGKVPPVFEISTQIDALSMKGISELYVVYIVQTPTKNFSLATTEAYSIGSTITVTKSDLGLWDQITLPSSILGDPEGGLPHLSGSTNPTAVILGPKGTYNIIVQIQAVCSDVPKNPDGLGACPSVLSVSALITPISLHFTGGAYGLLGTDNVGRDVWSQFVWGSQISLLIGILAGVGSVALGTIAGVAGGYLGGMTDEVLGRITDFVLVLPFLPLLIILVFILTSNPLFSGDIYFWIIIIFIIISWPTIAKIIRSQVLSVKERPYVEASRSLGSGTWHVLRKHILPNVMGLVYSQVALSVSGFILTEAALDYLSVSIHPITTITWGIMLTNALPFAVTDSAHSYVWWWFLPPGLAIAALSLAFVLVGFALDSVFNPKLRAR